MSDTYYDNMIKETIFEHNATKKSPNTPLTMKLGKTTLPLNSQSLASLNKMYHTYKDNIYDPHLSEYVPGNTPNIKVLDHPDYTSNIDLFKLIQKTTENLYGEFLTNPAYTSSKENTYLMFKKLDTNSFTSINPIADIALVKESDIKNPHYSDYLPLTFSPLPKNRSPEFLYNFILSSLKNKPILNPNLTYTYAKNQDIEHIGPHTIEYYKETANKNTLLAFLEKEKCYLDPATIDFCQKINPENENSPIVALIKNEKGYGVTIHNVPTLYTSQYLSCIETTDLQHATNVYKDVLKYPDSRIKVQLENDRPKYLPTRLEYLSRQFNRMLTSNNISNTGKTPKALSDIKNISPHRRSISQTPFTALKIQNLNETAIEIHHKFIANQVPDKRDTPYWKYNCLSEHPKKEQEKIFSELNETNINWFISNKCTQTTYKNSLDYSAVKEPSRTKQKQIKKSETATSKNIAKKQTVRRTR